MQTENEVRKYWTFDNVDFIELNDHTFLVGIKEKHLIHNLQEMAQYTKTICVSAFCMDKHYDDCLNLYNKNGKYIGAITIKDEHIPLMKELIKHHKWFNDEILKQK